MAAVDDLQFEEFGDVATSLAANPDATTINIEGPGETPKRLGPPRGSGREEDDELLGNDDSDKTELLAGQKKSSPFWTFEYYQTFFDVDTYQVFDRIKGSLLPIPGKNFVRLYIRSNPDLYGPFWICATLVFAIAISGNLSNFLIHLGEKTYHYVPEFRKGCVHSSHNHLCLRLAGSLRTLGFPPVEKQQSYEHRFLFIFGDCVRLWIFTLHLYPHSNPVDYPPESCSLDSSHDGAGHLRLCLGNDLLASCSGG
ncbi:protein YIPF1 isoform X2 [Myotis myotis]|uniref:protein YIPF1 isoform X2 n=1 Tax=Myotis myotis TaxID=51298 RepID=UPI00174888C0|nr:protein YIPF1 isoform X2 [Myotis myotis]